MEAKTLTYHRRQRLLKLLAEHGTVTVEQLIEWLNASAATIRRDLTWLDMRNLLVRTRGGATSLPQKQRNYPLSSESFQNSMRTHADSKRAIARYASGMCNDGETIIINGGSTTFPMAEFLAERHLKILTNSFLMAERLLATSSNEIILSGGKIYREQNVILSPFDSDITKHHYASKMFMSTYALTPLGLMEEDPLLVQAEKRLLGQTERLIVLADSSKFARKAGLILCNLASVSCVITDTDVSDAAVQMLEQSGIQVVTVEPEPAPVLSNSQMTHPAISTETTH